MSYNCGEIIIKCKPFVHTLSSSQKSIRCDFCFQLKQSLKKCGNCNQMYYCDKKCQKRDWIECHKNECQIINNFGHNLVKDCDRFLLRLWLLCKFKTERKSETYELYNGLKRSFNDLMTHSNQIREDLTRIRIFNNICHRFKSCHIDFDFEELFELFSKICINSFSILNEDLNEIGTAIYICGSVLNHSCLPNAVTVFNGIDLEVRPLKQISFGEEVFIHYIDLKSDTNLRKTKLREQYYFDCNCLKCLNHLDSNIDFNLVNNLNKEFDELIEQKEWHKSYSIGIKTIPLLYQIYGDFHPDITIQLIRLLKVKAIINQRLDDQDTLELIRKTKLSIKITHGFQHPIYHMFNDLTGF